MAGKETTGSHEGLSRLRVAVSRLAEYGITDQTGMALSKLDRIIRVPGGSSSDLNDQLDALTIVSDLGEDEKDNIRQALLSQSQRKRARDRSIREGILIGFYGAALALATFVTVDSHYHIQQQIAQKQAHPRFARITGLQRSEDLLQQASVYLFPVPLSRERPNAVIAKRYIDASLQQLGIGIDVDLDRTVQSLLRVSEVLTSRDGSTSQQDNFLLNNPTIAMSVNSNRSTIQAHRINKQKDLKPFEDNISKAERNRTLGGLTVFTLLATQVAKLLTLKKLR